MNDEELDRMAIDAVMEAHRSLHEALGYVSRIPVKNPERRSARVASIQAAIDALEVMFE